MREKLYELTCIFDPDYSREGLEPELNKVEELIKKFEGRIAKIDVWSKRRLIFSIKKKREGWYVTFYFFSNPNVPSLLNEQLKINEKLLRYLFVRSDEKIIKQEVEEPVNQVVSE